MSEDPDVIRSPWRWPMLVLWCAFFLMGLFPEAIYFQIRNAGGVVTQNALVNSPVLLYLGLLVFVTHFAYARCREHGLDPALSRAKALTILVYGMIGFLPMRAEAVVDYAAIPIPAYRNLLLATVALKGLCWAYLFVLVLRYHFLQGAEVFAGLPTLLPSVRRSEPEEPAVEEGKSGDAP